MIPVLATSFTHLHATLSRWRSSKVASTPPDVPFPLAHPDLPLPAWVAHDPLVQKYQALLGALPWADFPERPLLRPQQSPWPGPQPAPRAPFVASFLVKLHENKRYI